jgi:hypothetical protein
VWECRADVPTRRLRASALPAFGPPDSADLSLAARASAPEVQVGGAVTLILTLTNSGIDAATVAAPLGSRPVLTLATPPQGGGDAATGVWTLGSVAPGAAATAAEVTGPSARDPDSTSGNGAVLPKVRRARTARLG